MEIRKLTEFDYDTVIELYKELDEIHVQARPDYFVHRDKNDIYPKDAIALYQSMGMTPQRYVFEKKL